MHHSAEYGLEETLKHAARCHCSAKNHGTQDKPNGIHHTSHATSGHQVVEQRHASVHRSGCGKGGDDASEECFEGHYAIRATTNAQQYVALEYDGHRDSHDGGGEEHNQSGYLFVYKVGRNGWHYEQPCRDIERTGKRFGVGIDGLCGIGTHPDACYAKDDKRNEYRGDGGEHHVAYVLKQGCATDRGCQYGGVGEGRDLVAKVCTRDDGTCYPTLLKAQSATDAKEGNADGGNRCPRRTGHERHDGADATCRDEEYGRMYYLYAIADESGHNA